MAPGDAARLLGRVGSVSEADGGTGPFRSEVFGRWTGGPLPVDVMGGLRVFADGRWTEVRPVTREAVDLEGATVFLPSAAELAAIMRRFGRPKDLARARLLDALASG